MTNAENQIVVYQPNETMRLDVRLENRMADAKSDGGVVWMLY